MPLVRRDSGRTAAKPTLPAGLIEALASPREEERWSAARAAGTSPEQAGPLGAALRAESSSRVREALFTSLTRLGPAGIAEVLPLLRSDDANLRTGALDASRIMIRDASELLPPLLADEDPDVRILSCELARGLPAEEATRFLSELLVREPHVNVCAAAVDVLAEVGLGDALPALNACAQRFATEPYLAFAIQVTVDRIRASPRPSRA
jgi:HEAT repeat protein